jgi:hypothetical protein
MPVRRLRRQLRLVPALLVPTARAVGWGPPLAGFALGLGLLALAVRPGLELPAGRLVLWLRIAMVAGALGCAFLLDDPSEPTTEAVAGSLLLRRALRVALVLPAAAAWWAAVLWRVHAVHPGLPLPVAALTLEAAALLAVTVALAAAGSRLAPERRGGVVAAPALLALAAAAFLLPAPAALYAQPGAAWDDAHRRWALLPAIALAAFAAASRDPGRRRLRGLGRRLARGRSGARAGASVAAEGAGHPAGRGRLGHQLHRAVDADRAADRPAGLVEHTQHGAGRGQLGHDPDGDVGAAARRRTGAGGPDGPVVLAGPRAEVDVAVGRDDVDVGDDDRLGGDLGLGVARADQRDGGGERRDQQEGQPDGGAGQADRHALPPS